MAKQPEINLDALMRGDAAGIQPWVEEEDNIISSDKLRSQIAEIIMEKEALMSEGANASDANHKRFLALSDQLEPIVNKLLNQYPEALNNAGHLELQYIIKHTNGLRTPEAAQNLEAAAKKYVEEYAQGQKREGLTTPSQIRQVKSFIEDNSSDPKVTNQALEQLDKDEQEIFKSKLFQETRTLIFAQETNANKYPALQPETYSKADIKKLMDEYNQFIITSPKDADKDKFNAEFEQTVIGGTKDVEDFASGLLSAEPDALDDMEKYIELFGKEYVNGKYVLTPAAEKALARIKDTKKIALEKAAAKKLESEKATANKPKDEKAKLAKIKEINKKKPQDITLQDYLFLKEVIEENSRKTPEQKAKDIESLTSRARIRMKDPTKVKAEELAVVPAFITAFGYDKGDAINKDAMRFRDAIAKSQTQSKENETQIIPITPTADITTNQAPKTSSKDKKLAPKSFWGKTKDWAKRNWKHIAVVTALIVGTLLVKNCSNDEKKGDGDRKEDKKEVITPIPVIKKQANDSLDLGMTMQYAKRIGHQEKLSPEAAAKRTVQDLAAFKKLPDEIKAKFAGKSDEEKLARLGVVRGDQDKLHKPIDELLAGKKINPLTLKDISERSSKVTDDFGAHKDNNLKNGKQTIEMSAYQVQKAFQEKGTNGK